MEPKTKIISNIEQQKIFLKKQGKKLRNLWRSEAYKTLRYLNFIIAKPKSE